MRHVLFDLSRTELVQGIELILNETKLPPPLPSVASSRTIVRRSDPVYLLVRQIDSSVNASSTLDVSLLPTGSKAPLSAGKKL